VSERVGERVSIKHCGDGLWRIGEALGLINSIGDQDSSWSIHSLIGAGAWLSRLAMVCIKESSKDLEHQLVRKPWRD